MFNNLIQLLDEKNYQTDIWENSKFKNIKQLSCDEIGYLGEELIYNVCKEVNIPVTWDKNKNTIKKGQHDPKTFDMKIFDKLIEIKTATLGKNNNYQHENLCNDQTCDYWFFIDISPYDIHLTILKKFNLKEKHHILNKTPHLRKNTTGVFKLDFSHSCFKKYIQEGITISIKNGTDIKKIKNFIWEKLQIDELVENFKNIFI